ncbi:MAG: extracellular solute-binding protein [Treponema sp.]|jgi:ABC-type glycerol-3-phosphate transport system substrate-binding protein|nr:extracellular solute-binding protein [Treponema sp.]
MKKLGLFVLVLLCVTTLVFVGCNKNKGSSGKTIVKLGIWPEDTLPAEVAMHQEFVKQFYAKYNDVELQPAQYRYAVDTFVSMSEAGQAPTVFETWFTEPQKLINGGFVKDITSEMRALGWDSKMNPAIRDLMSKDGKLYGVPRDAYALGLMLNVQLFREAGLVDRNGIPLYPKTWDELATVAQTIKQKTGSAGLCLLAKDNAGGWHFTNIAWGFGAVFMVQRGGKWAAQVNTPQVAAALQYVKDLKWKYDVLTADPTNEDWGTGFRAIGTGAAAMYIAAQDAVNQPTEANGLPVGDLALVPVPAGPGGQFSLMGGTPYMFAANATSEQVNGALRYLEIMGRGPVVDETTIAGLRADAQRRKNAGVPVIPEVPAWTDPALLKAKQDAIDAFKNVDDRLYADYYTAITRSGNLKSEEPMLAQDLYSELTKCLQAVLTDRNANVQALLDTAQKNFQSLLDQQVN